MLRRDGELWFSPSDLNIFFESRFASFMDRDAVEHPAKHGERVRDAQLELVAEMGLEHERNFLASLRKQKGDLCEIERGKGEVARTTEAILSGREIIFQAALELAPFRGYADFLFRVDAPGTKLGFTYRVADTKLARKPKPYFLLQLCAYAEMLAPLLGHRPTELEVIAGDLERTTFRTDDFYFYYSSLKQTFLDAQAEFDVAQRPMPEVGADHRHWGDLADEIFESVDHPCRVANISKLQIRRLQNAGIETFQQLAETKLPRVSRMAQHTFTRLRAQARIQRASNGKHPPHWELLSDEERGEKLGLAMLPPASKLDVFFDMEGYPYLEGGLEYLFGATYVDRGQREFKAFWAYTQKDEKRAFEQFVDWAFARHEEDPAMHIYHYASYEVSALKKLMSRYGTREHEVDTLLRDEAFVDLFRVVRQAIRVGEPRYSLKNIEKLYRKPREGDVATAGDSIVEFASWLEAPDGKTCDESEILSGIRDYNREDCDSTHELAGWLRERQREAKVVYAGR